MKRSMPRISAMPATGIVGITDKRGDQRDERCALHSARALGSQNRNRQNRELLRQSQMRVRRLRHKKRRQRHVKTGAVGVERKSGGNDQSDE